MDVLQLSEDFYPKTSGGAFEDWEVARSLATDGHSVFVVTPRSEETPELETKDNVIIKRPYKIADSHPNSLLGQLTRIKFLLFVTYHLLQITSENNFDAIYSTNHLVHPAAKFLSIVRGYSVVNYVAYSPSIDKRKRYWTNPLYILEQLNFRFCMGEAVLCRTPNIQRTISTRCDARVRLVDGMVKSNEIKSLSKIQDKTNKGKNKINDHKETLVYVGRLVEIKNPVGAIEILAALPSRYQLIMIGEGPERKQVEQAIDCNGVADRVTLLGHCPHEMTLQYIQAADLLILTSDVEAYPTVVFEALALDTPVFSTQVGVLPEISHPKLHLCNLSNMKNDIIEKEYTSSQGISLDTINRFSIDRFTEKVCEELAVVSESVHQSCS